jgi:ABC-type nickel/cobalt efflux system permease component RcnA
MRRALVLAGCGMLGVGLSACESTEQESARIGHENEAAARAAAAKPAANAHAGAHSHGRRHGHGSAHGAPDKGSPSP